MTRTPPLLLAMIALVACADAELRPPAAAPPPTPTAAVVAPAPASETPVEASTPTPTPAAPPVLRVAIEGHRTLDFDLIGDRALVFTRAELHAIAADGSLAESFARPPEGLRFDIDAVGGRPGGSVFAVGNTGGRADYLPVLAFYDDGAWVRPRAASEGVSHAWPWIESSTLALRMSRSETDFPRLVVVRGAPRAPALDGLRSASRCVDPWVRNIDVDSSGSVALVLGCDNKVWVWSWRPGDAEGESHRLRDADAEVRGLDVRGERIALAVAADGGWHRFFLRDAGGWHDAEVPGSGDLRDVALDPAGVAWVVRGATLSRREGDAWVDATPPGDEPILSLAGVDVGAPWVVRGQRTLLARRGDAWDTVALPPAAFVADHTIKVSAIKVASGGQAWVLGDFYAKEIGRTEASHFNAILSTGPGGQPLRIGAVLGHDSIAPTPWPRTAGAGCSDRLVLLVPADGLDRTGDFKGLRKQLRGHPELGSPRFVELELGALRFVAAITGEPAAADGLVAIARKVNRWRSPEVLCGDQAELDRASAKTTRELAIDLVSGELKAP